MRNHFKTVGLTAIAIVLIQTALGVGVYLALPDWTSRGQFGDIFGVVNALFSGLAFAGLIYAILLQREDLSLQRNELEMTREELRRSATAQEQSERALAAQAAAATQSAKLAATNFLLDYYRKELGSMGKQLYLPNDPRVQKVQDLEQREQVLISILNATYIQLSKEQEDHAEFKNR
jgi:hypothetical protein